MQNTIEFGSVDNTTTSTSSQPELQHAPVNRVIMKPPPFYRTNPTVWFGKMESQFVFAGITNDTTKYHHILTAIPEDVAINLPMEIEDYSSLKDSITEVYQKSKTELIEEALGTISLDGQKPSVCLLRNQRKLSECHLTMDNDVIKHRLMCHANLNVFLTFRTFGPATRQIHQTSRHHIQLLEGHISGQPARLRHTALIVIVLFSPAATNAKKQHSRQQY